MKLPRALFNARLLPSLLQLGTWLYDKLDGNLERAETEIALIRNHGLRLDEARARVDAELKP